MTMPPCQIYAQMTSQGPCNEAVLPPAITGADLEELHRAPHVAALLLLGQLLCFRNWRRIWVRCDQPGCKLTAKWWLHRLSAGSTVEALLAMQHRPPFFSFDASWASLDMLPRSRSRVTLMAA